LDVVSGIYLDTDIDIGIDVGQPTEELANAMRNSSQPLLCDTLLNTMSAISRIVFSTGLPMFIGPISLPSINAIKPLTVSMPQQKLRVFTSESAMMVMASSRVRALRFDGDWLH
jgi:hypothetical protein